jgi:hypothetical protein
MVVFGFQGMCVFPGFQGMGEGESFIAKKPVSFRVSMSGNDSIPLLLKGSDANLKTQLIAGDLAIVSNQVHFDEGRIEF